MSEIFNNNCERVHLVLPGLGSKCASGLFCASDLVILSRSRSCYLLWSYMDPPAEEQSITSTVTCPPCQSSQSWGHAGGRARSVCVPVHVPPMQSLSCRRHGRTQGHELLPWPGLGEAAVPANGVGESPTATQRSGVLKTMAAPAPHTSLSKEPCF